MKIEVIIYLFPRDSIISMFLGPFTWTAAFFDPIRALEQKYDIILTNDFNFLHF